jgi:hypothetical protein
MQQLRWVLDVQGVFSARQKNPQGTSLAGFFLYKQKRPRAVKLAGVIDR